ncbi:MAG TPA: hypothetical protein VMF55_03525 [Solirubrobacterales bacterium]|nr:hypothetical protein [Solirubrobacterales bacterium]
MVQTIAAPPRPSRRRKRPRGSEVAAPPSELPLARATAIRAFEPYPSPEEAAAWLTGATVDESTIDAAVAVGIGLLNDALHAQAVAAADPHVATLPAERAVAVRLGYGSGDQIADGAFRDAREVDVGAAGSPRRRRQEELRPQERVAAVLRGRETFAACEPLLLRARADLDAGRSREATLQLRIGAEALLAELPSALDDDDHRADIAALEEQMPAVEAAATRALTDDLDPEQEPAIRNALQLAERILRRRRVLST